MAGSKKIIIACASTGASMTPSMSQYLPVPPAQIAAQSTEGVKAGAAIVHLHGRDPIDGRPTNDPAVWEQFMTKIGGSCDGSLRLLAERMRPHPLGRSTIRRGRAPSCRR